MIDHRVIDPSDLSSIGRSDQFTSSVPDLLCRGSGATTSCCKNNWYVYFITWLQCFQQCEGE